jgi:hypothetical protein
MQDLNAKNVVSISKWRRQKFADGRQSYLKGLSFNQLMQESEELISDLKTQEADQEISIRTYELVNEFNRRVPESRFDLKNIFERIERIFS